MPIDQFTNARSYYDPTFPNSGDGFSISGFKNTFQGLGFMDFLPLQPRAHSPGDMRVMVRGRDTNGFYSPVYATDNNTRIFFNSGDSSAMSAPSSNPRLDIVYLTPSGDIRIVTGSEAAAPTLPTLSPSGDRMPICAVYHKVGETKIVNFEDRNSNTGDGYIYQDLRPHFYSLAQGTQLTNTAPVSPTGDNAVGTAGASARADHRHQGLHTIKLPGSGDLFGDVELHGDNVTQQGNRITVNGLIYKEIFSDINEYFTGAGTVVMDDTAFANTEGFQLPAKFFPSFTALRVTDWVEVQVELTWAQATGQNLIVACGLFIDSETNARKVCVQTVVNNETVNLMNFKHRFKAGSVAQQTVKLRFGDASAITMEFNKNITPATSFVNAVKSSIKVTLSRSE